jgi:hypothetical protein
LRLLLLLLLLQIQHTGGFIAGTGICEGADSHPNGARWKSALQLSQCHDDPNRLRSPVGKQESLLRRGRSSRAGRQHPKLARAGHLRSKSALILSFLPDTGAAQE